MAALAFLATGSGVPTAAESIDPMPPNPHRAHAVGDCWTLRPPYRLVLIYLDGAAELASYATIAGLAIAVAVGAEQRKRVAAGVVAVWALSSIALGAMYPSPLVRGTALQRVYFAADLIGLFVSAVAIVGWTQRALATKRSPDMTSLVAFLLVALDPTRPENAESTVPNRAVTFFAPSRRGRALARPLLQVLRRIARSWLTHPLPRATARRGWWATCESSKIATCVREKHGLGWRASSSME